MKDFSYEKSFWYASFMSPTTHLNGLIDFVGFTHEIRKVKRSMWVRDEEQSENDSEHGYQLALVALYIIEENNLDLDPYKSMGIALVHDILEVHSGDTPVFASADMKATQAERERNAVQALCKQWPHMKLMLSLIEEYESRSSDESKFIYALDKLIPIINNYLDNGRNWHKNGISLDNVISVKKGKVDIDPTIAQYYLTLINLLRTRPDLFS